LPQAVLPAPAASPFAPAPHRRTRPLHLAAAIDGRGQYTADHYLDLTRLAEAGALDFVTLGGRGDTGLDAVAVLARIAPATDRIGLVAAMAASCGEPAELALAVATLDRVSQGRAGWTVTTDEPGPKDAGGDRGEGSGAADGGSSAGSYGAQAGEPADTAAGLAARVAEARRAAERNEARRRSAERLAAAVAPAWDGGALRARHGRPVIAVDATDPAAHATAARHADIAFVRAAATDQAHGVRSALRRLCAEAGRDPDRLLVLADLSVDLGGGELGAASGAETALVPDGAGGVLFSGGPVVLADLITEWQRSGAVDGFHVRPVEPRRDLERFVNGTAALLQHRGLFRSFHPGATLREHLGLHRPANRPTVAGGAAS
jgi:alkanesulfonate monooxygenase SsuD/methylene tetrahydromethanopterin reductase-like flavin-dependent oxidoreductase (luciferase family)